MDYERPTNSNGLALGLVVLNGFGMLIAFTGAVILGLVAVSDSISSYSAAERAIPILSLGWVSGLVGLVLLVGLVQATAHLKGKTLPQWRGMRGMLPLSIPLGLVWPAALLAGNALAENITPLSLVFLPLCLILAVGLPTWWLMAFAQRGLKTPPHRAWGTASVVVIATLPLAMLVELVLILAGSVFLLGLISNDPNLVSQLNQLVRSISNGNITPEKLTDMLEPFLSHPGVVFFVISGLAVVVPLVEETLKPLGLWFLAKRGISPRQGFVLGATSGAAFALVESLATLSSITGEGWMVLALGRAGTSLLHITCSALVGWGLGLAWTRAKYWHLAGLFLAAVAIHGAWNGFAQFLGLMPFFNQPALAVQNAPLSEAAIFTVLGILLVTALIILIAVNRHLHKEQQQEEAVALATQAAPTAWATPSDLQDVTLTIPSPAEGEPSHQPPEQL